MNYYTTLNHDLKRDILQFCEKISKNLKCPEAKFVSQMCYGMLASQSCLLTEIGRNLNEEISLKKTVTRLSRNLNQFDEKEQISENYLDTIAHRYNHLSPYYYLPMSKQLWKMGIIPL